MKRLFVAVIAFSAMYISGCNSGGGDPKTVLTSFFDAMAKKDIAAARKLATADSKSMFDMMEEGMKMAGNIAEDKTKEQFDKSKMEMSEAKIDGDRATVNVKDLKSGESIDFVLKKESGSWKVAMDMGTMMNIGVQKMKEKGMDGALDSLQSGLEQLKNINTDSLKELMNKGMQIIDSLKSKVKTN